MKKKALLVLAAALTLIFSYGGIALAEEGVTATEIHIGSWGPQTGPAAAWGSVPRATEAYFKMINEEGGIHGRKLVLHHFDDAYNPAKTKAGVKQLQESSHGIFAWAGGVGTSNGLAIMDYLMDRKVPWIAPATGSTAWTTPPRKYLFTVYPPYDGEARILMRYAVQNFKGKRLAIVYQNDEYGKTGLRGAEQELAVHGVQFSAKVPQNVTETDMKPIIMRLKKAEADVVLLWVSPSSLVRILLTGKAMKFDPQWMTTSTCSDLPLFWKISRGAIKGIIAAALTEMPDSQNAMLLRYKRNVYEKHAGKGERWGVFYYAGIVFAEPLVEALRRVGPNLTRERLVQELEGLKDFKGISGKITYKPFDPNDRSSRLGLNSVFVIQCLDNADYTILSDWVTLE